MGIRPVLCLPEGCEVFGMETGTFSLEQRSSRSVGKLTHLTQRSLLPRWARDPNTCCKLPDKSSHHPEPLGCGGGEGPLSPLRYCKGWAINQHSPNHEQHSWGCCCSAAKGKPRPCYSLKKMINSPHMNNTNMLKKHNLVLFLLYGQAKTAFKDGSKHHFPMGYFSIQ